MSIPLIVIAGPTASGKTALAVALAKALNGEVVSADSMQIYKDISVGTAKPTAEEMEGIPHHLMDFVPLQQEYSVADYVTDATAVIADIVSRGKQPIVAGGTGLYIRSLITHTQFEEIKTDETLRKALYAQAQTPEGLNALYQELQQIDPESAQRIHPNNLVRVIRAVEVYRLTGKTMTQMQKESRTQESPYAPIAFLGITCRDRAALYERIDRRVDWMVENGLLEEAKRLFACADKATAFQAIGYKELSGYFAGEEPLETALERLKQNSRRYAKRQLTWFRREEQIHWLYREDYADADALVQTALDYVTQIFHKNN